MKKTLLATTLLIILFIPVAQPQAESLQDEVLRGGKLQNNQLRVEKDRVVVGREMYEIGLRNRAERLRMEVYPESKSDRVEVIVYQLEKRGYSGSDIGKWRIVIERESGASGHDPRVEPRTWVKHCFNGSSWYAVEITSQGTQAYCREGDLEGKNEKSTGIFQILWSSWKNYGCKGDKYDWKDQIECAVRMQKHDGWGHWHYL